MKHAIEVHPKYDPDPMSLPELNNIEQGFIIEVDNLKIVNPEAAMDDMIEVMNEAECDIMVFGYGGFIIPRK